jgi:hypothetical protein
MLAKTAFEGWQTATLRRKRLDWRKRFKLHRWYGKRIWGALVATIVLIEGVRIQSGIRFHNMWMYIHLFADFIFFISFCLLHVFDGMRFPRTHTILACVCLGTFSIVVVPTGLYYFFLLLML